MESRPDVVEMDVDVSKAVLRLGDSETHAVATWSECPTHVVVVA